MRDEQNIALEKKLSPRQVWALAFGCIIGCGAFIMPGDTFLVQAGPLGTALAFGIAALAMIVVAFNYHFMINKYPVAGGEFTYAANTFGRINGFICAWFLGLSYLTIVPINATALAVIGRNLFDDIFQVGFHYQVAGFDIYFGEIVLAIVALVVFALLSIRGVKTTGVFQMLLVIALIGGVFIVFLAAILNPHVSAKNLLPAFAPEGSKAGGILAIIAIAPFSFVGFDTIPQAAEEFNFSPKKAKGIMVLAILFGAAMYVVITLITAMAVPEGYATWAEYVKEAGKLEGLLSLPTFHAAKQLLGTPGLIFIGMAVLGAILSGIMGFYMATSRLLYSMSKEKMLPEWFGRVQEKQKTPKNAILFVMCVSIIAPFFGRTVLGWIVDMSSVGAAIGYGYTSGAAFCYAKKQGDKKIMLTGLIGMLIAFMILVLLLVPIKGLDCSLGVESYVCLLAWSLLGWLFYKKTNKRKK